MADLLEMAWGLIANAHGGDWDQATPEWREAAERWRDEYGGSSADSAATQAGKHADGIPVETAMWLLWCWYRPGEVRSAARDHPAWPGHPVVGMDLRKLNALWDVVANDPRAQP